MPASCKRKASNDGGQPSKFLHLTQNEENNGSATSNTHSAWQKYECEDHADHGYMAHVDQNVLDEIHTRILREEEDVRVESELSLDYDIDSDMEREYAEVEFLAEVEAHQIDYPEDSVGSEAWNNEMLIDVLAEEEAVRVEAELECRYPTGSEIEQNFDADGHLFQEMDDVEYDERPDYYEGDTIKLDVSYSGMDEDYASPFKDPYRMRIEPQHRDLDSGYAVFPTKDDIYFDSRIQADEAERSDTSFQKELCWSCSKVRWFKLPTMSLSQRRSVHKLRGSPLKLQESWCSLCRFWGSLLTGDVFTGDVFTDTRDGKLTIEMSLRQTIRNGPNVLNATIHGELEQSILSMTTLHSWTSDKGWQPRVLDRAAVDYNALKRMFRHCRHQHGLSCRSKPVLQRLGFKVIDCSSRNVVQAPPYCNYVALSYVWGETPATEPTSGSDNSDFPLTIEDSIHVTEKLGFRYLWVDRYCIDQDNKAEKHAIIQSMDDIYAQAQVTLIAAAGPNPTYGLPGISTRPRTLEHSVRIGNTKLVQLMLPGPDFPHSPWWKRSWTYQEGVLSKRKLVFTDHQVYYVCNGMRAAEIMHLHDPTLSTPLDASSFTSASSFSEMLWQFTTRSYVSYLSDISRRALSHPSDALNTCLGILKATNTTHIWGVPAEIQAAKWNHTIALHWRHDGSATRRLGFPSWSWAGWQGGVNMRDSTVTCAFGAVFVGSRNDSLWQTVHAYISSGRAVRLAGKDTAPCFLKIRGEVVDAAFLRDQWPDVTDFGYGEENDRPRARFSLAFESTSALCVLYMDERVESAEEMRDVVALGMGTESEECCVSALLLKPSGDVYRRVGLMRMMCEASYCCWSRGEHAFWMVASRSRTVIIE